jgi:cytochrome c551/c552
MGKLTFLLLLAMATGLALGSSGTSPTAAPSAGPGNATGGRIVFSQVAAPPCTPCHSIRANVTIVGPSLASVGTRAGSRVSGMTAAEYLRESIVDPDAYLVPDFGPSVMPGIYGKGLTTSRIDDLVAYLMTLR